MGRKGWFAKYSEEESGNNLLIPTLGTFYSHAGNILFPRWEHFIPTLGILFILICFTKQP